MAKAEIQRATIKEEDKRRLQAALQEKAAGLARQSDRESRAAEKDLPNLWYKRY